jgi:hypothetical protein
MMSISIDSIRSADYSKNAGRCGEYEPCFVCGKPIKQIARYVHVHEGGSSIVTAEEAAALNAAGRQNADMGVMLIGPDCARRPEIKPYIIP